MVGARSLLALVIAVSVTPACHAQESLAQDLPSIDALRPPPVGMELPSLQDLTDPARTAPFEEIAREMAARSSQQMITAIPDEARQFGIEIGEAAEVDPPGERILPDGYRASIFVSTSMGRDALLALLQRYGGKADVRLIFRGIPADMNVPTFAAFLLDLTREAGAPPAQVLIDPEFFTAAGVTAVPTTVIEDLSRAGTDSDLDLAASRIKAVGFSGVTYVWGRAEGGDTDIRQGSVREIAEEDLIARMMRNAEARLDQITRDPEEITRRYWERQTASLARGPVTPAAVDRTRPLFFAFTAPDDIRDSSGAILAYRGQVFSPYDVMKWDRRHLVIDPTRPVELDWLERKLTEQRPGVARTMIILTRVPPAAPGAAPWQGIQDLVTRFKTQVFLLTDQYRSGFAVEHTPTEIFPDPDGVAMSEESAL